VSTVLADLQEVTARAFYHPSGAADDVQVLIESDRVRVWTSAEFRRPVKLTMKETLALHLGLRMLAGNGGGNPDPGADRPGTLADRLRERVSSPGADALNDHYAASGIEGDPAVRATLIEAARHSRACEITYLKRGATSPESRDIEPYAILIAYGHAYVVARCTRANGIRLFRCDRVLEAKPLDRTFTVPPDFDPLEYTAEGRVFRADDAPEVTVRYAPSIAAWIREGGPVEDLEDGSVVVRYRLADADWVVAHVLRHGAEAEVVEPEEVREMVVRALREAAR
jgi:proteasome accessory factor C